MQTSVILRCKNEDQWVGHAIQSVIDHFEKPEIVFIDNGSSDDSADVVRMFDHHVDIKKLSIDNYSPGKALNVGATHCKYDKILILSAHCVLQKFDPEVESQLEQHAAVFGKQIPVFRGRKISRRYVWSNFTSTETVNMFSSQENRYFLHNAMCFYKKDMLLRFPFDEQLYGKEDRYWADAVISAGYTILYNPKMECLHHWTHGGATWHGIG